MSLESQIASLVSASNDLTEVVASKVDAIDTAVTTMKNDIGGFLTNLVELYTIEVDAVTGDDAAADENGATVRTFAEALRRVKPFHSNHIQLASRQTHYFTQDVRTTETVQITGNDYGNIHIYDRDHVSSAAPNENSPVLAWAAELSTAMDVIFGGFGAPISVHHTAGRLTSDNSMSGWGTGSPVRAQTSLASTHLHLNAASSVFVLRPGHVMLNWTAIFQNAPGAMLTPTQSQFVSFFQDNCYLGGSENPTEWQRVVGVWATSTADLARAISRVRITTIYVNTDSGDDRNSGLSESAPVRTAGRLAEITATQGAIEQVIEVRGSADFVLDTDIGLFGDRNTLSFQFLTGNLVIPSFQQTDNAGTVVGEAICSIVLRGNNNLVIFNHDTPRKTLTLPSKGGYSGNGDSWHYARRQGLFRMGTTWTTSPSHLSIIGVDISIGSNQTLVALDSGLNTYYQNNKKLVVLFANCSTTLVDGTATRLFGVSEAIGTITDAYT